MKHAKTISRHQLILADIFDMLEDPRVHVKTQNALIKGCKHQIIK
jgi:acid stress-induced BolA-like protein IbaG/YrbA